MSVASGRKGYTSHNGVEFPIVWLKKKNANGTKFSKDDCVKFAKAGGTAASRAPVDVKGQIAALESQLKDLDIETKISKILPGEAPPEIDRAIKAGKIGKIDFRVTADERNIILQLGNRVTYHSNLEGAMQFTNSFVQRSMINDRGTFTDLAELIKVVNDARKAVEKAWK